MKNATKQRFPPGWNEKKVRDLIRYYDNQTEDEGAAEIETADEAPGETWMSVPTALVPAVAQLIEDHEHEFCNTRARNQRGTKAHSRRAR
jgi:hypothetical protein